MLDDNVRWGGEEDTPETCHTRGDVLSRLAHQRANGFQTRVLEVVPGDEAVLLGVSVKGPIAEGFDRGRTVYQVLRLRVQLTHHLPHYGSHARAGSRAVGVNEIRDPDPAVQGLLALKG